MLNIQNITSKLASMPDAALKQYAEMHKDDPYTFSLALSESNRRKHLRTQAPQQAPQPKVVDQELESMKTLPEDQGIARIPIDMNMASGGIVAFDEGGDVNYSNEGRDAKLSYRAYALEKAKEKGIDPALVDSIFKIESNYKADAQSPTGPQGIGQLTAKTGQAYGVDPKDRKDPYKNIDASIAFMADLNKKYDGDPAKIAVAYNQGETVLNKHLRANKGELNAPTLPTEAQGYLKKLQKLAFNLAPGATAQAETVPPKPTTPKEQGIAAIPATQAAPQPDEENYDAETAAATAAAGLGYYPAKTGVASLKDKIKAADAARVIEGSKVERALADQAARNTSLPRLAGPAGGGVTAATDQALAQKAAERVAAKQAAITGSEMAGKYGLGTAVRGLGSAARLAVNPAVAGLGALGEQLGGFQRGVMAAPTGEKLKEALYENPMLGAMDPDAAFGAAIMDAPKIAEKKAAALNPNARVDDRTKRTPELYRPAPAAPAGPDDTQREVQSLLNRHPAPEASKKEIIAAAKEAAPPTKETEGWSGNDWLQFGLSMMAGQSPNALQNIGAAGLGVIASRAEQAQAQKKLDLYRTIHEEKPGEKTRSIDRLMKEDPSLSYADALEKYTQLTGGATKQDIADAKAAQVKATNLRNFNSAKAELDKKYSPMIMSGTSPTAQAMRTRYEADLQALRAEHDIPAPEKSTTSASVIPGAKIVGTR